MFLSLSFCVYSSIVSDETFFCCLNFFLFFSENISLMFLPLISWRDASCRSDAGARQQKGTVTSKTRTLCKLATYIRWPFFCVLCKTLKWMACVSLCPLFSTMRWLVECVAFTFRIFIRNFGYLFYLNAVATLCRLCFKWNLFRVARVSYLFFRWFQKKKKKGILFAWLCIILLPLYLSI